VTDPFQDSYDADMASKEARQQILKTFDRKLDGKGRIQPRSVEVGRANQVELHIEKADRHFAVRGDEEVHFDVHEDAEEEEDIVGGERPRSSLPQVRRRTLKPPFANGVFMAPGEDVAKKIWDFEQQETEVQRTQRLRKQTKARKMAASREADHFLDMMREKGGGSVTIAWRRHFDSDGDGELSFTEFCNALADLEYKVDTVKLWHEFGGKSNNSLGLQVLDPDGANILDYFAEWCVEMMGGPIEVFRHMDSDGSDSLEPDEFAEGLADLGFFEAAGIPSVLNSEEGVLTHLYPLLDQNGFGCIQADQMLFLEKDKEKRERLQLELARIREFGHDVVEEVKSEASAWLHKTGRQNIGRKHWKQIKAHNSLGSSPTASARQTPSSFRSRSPNHSAKSRTPKAMSVTDFHKESPTHAQAAMSIMASTTGASMTSSRSLPQLPSSRAGKKSLPRRVDPTSWAAGQVERSKDARKIYRHSLVPALPPMNENPAFQRPGSLPVQRRRAKGRHYHEFDASKTHDHFLISGKQRSLWEHYYVTGPVEIYR